ncbi:hypothetical protein QYF36_010708 [Acer negundo]|nr:hypothetical protein QYF36_010708 [Acer negundo]
MRADLLRWPNKSTQNDRSTQTDRSAPDCRSSIKEMRFGSQTQEVVGFWPSGFGLSGVGPPGGVLQSPSMEIRLNIIKFSSLFWKGKIIIHGHKCIFTIASTIQGNFMSLRLSNTPHSHSSPIDFALLLPVVDEHILQEIVFMQVLDFDIGTSNIAFIFLEELLVQFKEVARVGEFVSFEACMDLMDLLYEKEETSILYRSPRSLAASVAAYVITAPKQRCEFPVLSWVNFVTSIKEEDVVESVGEILKHVFETR